MARSLTSGIVIAEHLAVLREFVDAVQERDPDVITACLQYTPPGRMAEIAAQWVHELLIVIEHQDDRLMALQGAGLPAGEVLVAYRAAQRHRYEAETRNEKLVEENRVLRDRLERIMAQQKAAA